MVTESIKRTAVRTRRLLLRSNLLEDAPELNEILRHPEVAHYLQPNSTRSLPLPLENTRERIVTRLANENCSHIILLLAPEHHLPPTASGVPAVSDLGSDPSHAALLSQARIVGSIGMRKEHTVGYTIRREEWGKGLATEATVGLLAMVWAKQAEWERDAAASPGTEVERPWGVLPKEAREQGGEPCEFLSASFNPANVGSGRVMQKAGGVMADSAEVEDWDQTPEERERDGARMFTLHQYRFWRPAA